MKFSAKIGNPAKLLTQIALVPVYENGELGFAANSFKESGNTWIEMVLKSGDISGKVGETYWYNCDSSSACDRVLLVGCGPKNKFDRRACAAAIRSAVNALSRRSFESVISYFCQEPLENADTYRASRMEVKLWHEVSYTYATTKTKNLPSGKSPGRIELIAANEASLSEVERGVCHGNAIGTAMNFARELGNLPPNICTPSYLAEKAIYMARFNANLTVEVLEEEQIMALGMGAFLAVTSGSISPAKFIIMRYRGAADSAQPVVLVGKGITFDTGGISLKEPDRMDEMKFDMSGAASVMGTMHAALQLELPINLDVLVPTCENMPGAQATRPGDVVKSMSGQTIEILNTDAEGRLILCDALTYALGLNPAVIIDVATLTGACIMALGKHRSGMMSNSDQLAEQLLSAGESIDDLTWRLPLDDEYLELLKSNFADFANVGGRPAGAVIAGCFLSQFVGDQPWAHLDIPGVAYNEGKEKGSTGRPVPLLVQFLINRSDLKN